MPTDGILRAYDALVTRLEPLARYRLDEPTGTLAEDGAGDLDGTYRNGVSLGQGGIVGSNAAAGFDGANDFVEVVTASGGGGSGPAKVIAFGDSLVAGSGIASNEIFPVRLEAALDAAGFETTVVNAGVGGERTGTSVNRIGSVLAQHPDADAVIVVLGTNDALAGVNPADVRANLASIISQIQAAGKEVLLVGVPGRFEDSQGRPLGYTNDTQKAAFEANYTSLAQELGVRLYPNYFEGMTHENGRLRPDGFHPSATGVEHLVANIDDDVVDVLRDAGAFGPSDDALLLADGTVEVWFNADTVGGTRGLVSKDAAGLGTGGHLSVWLQNGEVVASLQDTGGEHVVRSGATRVQAGQDAHVVLTFGAAGMHLYVDGVEVAADGYNGGTGATSGGRGNFEPLVIGALNGSSASGTTDAASSFFDGRIDEVNVYGRALTAAEVGELHGVGAGGGSLTGTALGDLLVGGADDDVIWGFGGDDEIQGGGGNDVIRGAAGNDRLFGEAGDDVQAGGAGNDRLMGGDGNDRLFGQGGNDALAGDSGDDVLRAGDGDDVLRGGGGRDVLYGDAGRDLLLGGNGGDLLAGGDGNDDLYGGADDDRLYGQAGGDRLDGGDGNDRLVGGIGNDRLLGGGGTDTLAGNSGDDALRGGDGDDVLLGGAGHDMLAGGSGNDRLEGGAGNDWLYGQAGDDLLIGHSGRNTLFGGPGADTARYLQVKRGGADVFNDFTVGEDVIDVGAVLSGFDPNASDAGDFVSLRDRGANAVLAVDPDGGADGFVDFVVLRNAAGTGLDGLLGADSLQLA